MRLHTLEPLWRESLDAVIDRLQSIFSEWHHPVVFGKGPGKVWLDPIEPQGPFVILKTYPLCWGSGDHLCKKPLTETSFPPCSGIACFSDGFKVVVVNEQGAREIKQWKARRCRRWGYVKVEVTSYGLW